MKFSKGELDTFYDVCEHIEGLVGTLKILHGYGYYDFEGLGVEYDNCKPTICITVSDYDNSKDYIQYDLYELGNDSKYFEDKRAKEQEELEKAKELELENKRIAEEQAQEEKDLKEYERLKLKFENNGSKRKDKSV